MIIMAGNMKEIKERIASVKNTSQITNAMNIISSTKFKRYEELVSKSREYANTMEIVFDNVISSLKNKNHVLFQGKKSVKNVGVILMTSDRGLCGSFNTQMLKEFEKLKKSFDEKKINTTVIAIGKKAKDFCKSKKVEVDIEHDQIIAELMVEIGKEISEKIVDMYLDNEYDEVYLIYSKFISAINYSVKVDKLLPLEKNIKDIKNKEYIFEDSEDEVLREFIPKALNVKIYESLLENTASEHSARRAAMEQSSNNAKDMIDKLTLEYNRVRQSGITQELTEIVAGSNIVK